MPIVTLAKPALAQKYGSPDFFDRGERIILVDGVRWGRTHVKSHGSRGYSYTFSQDGGDKIIDRIGYRGREHFVTVRSASERHGKAYIGGVYRLPDDWKSTEQLVQEKVEELVVTGKLRQPDVVKAERAKQAEERARKYAVAQAREDQAFRSRAAIAVPLSVCDPGYSDALDRVIAAMRWAQEQ